MCPPNQPSFRNAFPERYESAGFKARPRHPKPPPERTPDFDEYAQGNDLTSGLIHLDPAITQATQADSTAFIVQSLLNEHLAANWAGPLESDAAAAIDQAPAPGSLALDPALSAAGFEGSTLEELTDEQIGRAHV